MFVNKPRQEKMEEVPVTTQCEDVSEPTIKERPKKPLSAQPSPLDSEMKEKSKTVPKFDQEKQIDPWQWELIEEKKTGSNPLTSGQDVSETEKTTQVANVVHFSTEGSARSLELALDMRDLKYLPAVKEEKLYQVLKALAVVNLSAFDTECYKMVKTITAEEFFSCWSELKIIASPSLYRELVVVVEALSMCIENQPGSHFFGKFHDLTSEMYQLKQDQFQQLCCEVMKGNLYYLFGRNPLRKFVKLMSICCIEERTTEELLEKIKSILHAGQF